VFSPCANFASSCPRSCGKIAATPIPHRLRVPLHRIFSDVRALKKRELLTRTSNANIGIQPFGVAFRELKAIRDARNGKILNQREANFAGRDDGWASRSSYADQAPNPGERQFLIVASDRPVHASMRSAGNGDAGARARLASGLLTKMASSPLPRPHGKSQLAIRAPIPCSRPAAVIRVPCLWVGL
jgi:hypothetical protein